MQRLLTWFNHLQPYQKWLSVGFTVVMGFFGLVGGFNDVKQFWQDHFAPEPPKLTLTYEPQNKVVARSIFYLSFTAPNSGYVSLWNQESDQSRVLKVLPEQGTSGKPLNTAYRGETNLRFRTTIPQGTETYFLLWTPAEAFAQLPQREYATHATFMLAVKALQQTTPAQLETLAIPVFTAR